MITQSEQVKETQTVREAADYSPANGPAAEAGISNFTAEWRQIKADIEGAEGLLRDHAAAALRVGQALIRIRAALTPHKLWIKALEEHGISQPKASRYIRFAEIPPADREVFQREKWFSVSRAVGEADRRKGAAASEGDHSSTNSPAEAEIPADELCDRLAEVEQRVKLAIDLVNRGECELANSGADDLPEYAEDNERWQVRVAEIADDLRELIAEGLEGVLKRRLLPGRS